MTTREAEEPTHGLVDPLPLGERVVIDLTGAAIPPAPPAPAPIEAAPAAPTPPAPGSYDALTAGCLCPAAPTVPGTVRAGCPIHAPAL